MTRRHRRAHESVLSNIQRVPDIHPKRGTAPTGWYATPFPRVPFRQPAGPAQSTTSRRCSPRLRPCY